MGKKKKKPKAAEASAGADDDEAGVEASEVTVEVPAHADDGLQPDVATQPPASPKNEAVANSPAAPNAGGDAATGEDGASEASEDGTSPDGGAEAGSGGGGDGGGGGGGKKKKKKKGGAGGGPPPPAPDAQERFQKVLEQVRACDVAVSSANLSNCAIGDKKLRKLAEAVSTAGGKSPLTSIDLSMNLFTDAAVAALTAALAADGAAPSLLELNLDANALSAEGCEACRASLTPRTALVLRMPAPTTNPGGIAGGGPGNRAPMAERPMVVDDLGTASDHAFAAYFRAATASSSVEPAGAPAAAALSEGSSGLGGSGGASGQGDGEEAQPPMPLEEAAAAVLRIASDGCDSLGVPALRALMLHVTEEGKNQHSNPKVLHPAQSWCCRNLAALYSILQKPSPILVLGRIGRHRLIVVQTVAALVRAHRPRLSSALVETKPSLLRFCLHLMLNDAALSSIMHTFLWDLFDEVLTGGQGPPHKGLRTAMLNADASLPSAASAIGEAILRPTYFQRVSRGPMLRLASALQSAAEQDKQLGKQLMAEAAWAELVDELPRLHAESNPPQPASEWRCGPPPPKPGAMGGPGGGDPGLFAMLQSMGLSAGQGV